VFSTLARRFGVTVVAGSLVLPAPRVEEGRVVVEDGPLAHASFVFRPDGSLHDRSVKKCLLGHDERGFMQAGLIVDLPSFEPPAGRLGVLIGRDSFSQAPPSRVPSSRAAVGCAASCPRGALGSGPAYDGRMRRPLLLLTAVLSLLGLARCECGGEPPAREHAGASDDGGAAPRDGGADDDDGGQAVADAGARPADAGTEPADAGTEPADAGAPPLPDAGSVNPPVGNGLWLEAVAGPTSGFTTADAIVHVGGELFVVAVVTNPYAPVTLVSGFGIAWTKRRAQCSSRNTTGIELWTAQNPAANGPLSVTLAYETQDAALLAARYVNVRPSSPGQTASANSSGPAGPCTFSNVGLDETSYAVSLSPVSYGSLVFSAVTTSGASHAPGAGFVALDEVAFGALGLAAQEGVAAQSPLVVSGSLSGPADWAAVALELRGF
jgi:hypothetical protein